MTPSKLNITIVIRSQIDALKKRRWLPKHNAVVFEKSRDPDSNKPMDQREKLWKSSFWCQSWKAGEQRSITKARQKLSAAQDGPGEGRQEGLRYAEEVTPSTYHRSVRSDWTSEKK